MRLKCPVRRRQPPSALGRLTVARSSSPTPRLEQGCACNKRNIATGARELSHEVEPLDATGIYGMHLLVTPDGETWAYTYQRFLSNLYVVSGLK